MNLSTSAVELDYIYTIIFRGFRLRIIQTIVFSILTLIRVIVEFSSTVSVNSELQHYYKSEESAGVTDDAMTRRLLDHLHHEATMR